MFPNKFAILASILGGYLKVEVERLNFSGSGYPIGSWGFKVILKANANNYIEFITTSDTSVAYYRKIWSGEPSSWFIINTGS